MEYHLLAYFSKFKISCFLSSFGEVGFAKLWSPYCPILKSWLPGLHSQVANSTLLFCSLAILQNGRAYITEWTAQMNFKMLTNLKISGLSEVWIVFPVCPNFCPQKSDCPHFSFLHMLLPRAPPNHFFFLSLFYLFIVMALWSFRGALSKFKLPPKLKIAIYWEQIARFWLELGSSLNFMRITSSDAFIEL